MTSAQVRAARGLINWTVRDLAEKSGVHRNTITNFETGRYAGSPEAVAAIRAALELAGVVFLPENGNGPGVALRK
jgi:transcriptional regulator with XRE-family HTH domain